MGLMKPKLAARLLWSGLLCLWIDGSTRQRNTPAFLFYLFLPDGCVICSRCCLLLEVGRLTRSRRHSRNSASSFSLCSAAVLKQTLKTKGNQNTEKEKKRFHGREEKRKCLKAKTVEGEEVQVWERERGGQRERWAEGKWERGTGRRNAEAA